MKNTQSLHLQPSPTPESESQIKFNPLKKIASPIPSIIDPSIKTTSFFHPIIKRRKKKHDEKVLIKSEWRAMYNC